MSLNRDAQLAAQRRWYDRNREAERARSRAYAAANRDARRRRGLQWRQAHPDRVSATNQRMYAQRRGALGSHTEQEWQDRLVEFGGRCAYCLDAPASEKEHMTPLSRGGSNDISNIVPACRRCNALKGARTLLEATRCL